MADNQHVNKVVYGSTVLIDLTADTVTADKILASYTAHDATGNTITGTCDFDVNSQDANVKVAEILSGKTAYARGTKLTGTMPNNGSVSLTISTLDDSVSIAQGYHDGSGKVSILDTEKAKLIAANIKQGITILGVTGTLAVAQAPAYTNLLDAAIDMDGNIIGHTPMYKNMRYNSSSGAPVEHAGTNITGLLPIKDGDVVRIRCKGNYDISYQSIKFFKSDRTQVAAGYISFYNVGNGQAGTVINVDSANGVIDFEFKATSSMSTGAAYFSIVLYDTLENVIVTTNEEII